MQTKEKFIEKANKTHNNKYDYSKVVYINARTKVSVICPIHGKFNIVPDKHTNAKQGCDKCGDDYLSKLFRKSKEQFINEAKEIHGEKYDYSLVEYISKNKKVKIICKKHGEFEQTPKHHLDGCGCPRCMYKNEEIVGKTIEKQLINIGTLKRRKRVYHPVTLDGVIVKKFMIVDYLIKIDNKLYFIEYHGQQHTKPVQFGGISLKRAERNFVIQKRRDEELRNYCKNNNIKLLEKYFNEMKTTNIEERINNFIYDKDK